MLDLVIVLGFVAYSVAAGFRARETASRGLEEYFLAGRSLAGWRAGLSMAATQYAADTPLLAAGLIATAGVFALWRLWIYGLAFLAMGFVLGGCWRRAGVLTDAELVEVRYSGRGVTLLRGLKAVYFGTLINCTVLAMVLVAATRICETFLPWHEWLPARVFAGLEAVARGSGLDLASGASPVAPHVATADNLASLALILGFVALYSTTGGLRSVVTTDVAQLGLALAGTAAYAWVAVAHAGGVGGMLMALEARYGAERAGRALSLVPTGADALAPFVVVVGLQWLFQMNSDGTGYLAQRTMACRSDRDAATAGFVFTWAQVFVRSFLWIPIGVALLVVYPVAAGDFARPGFAAERELTFVTGIRDLLPAGVRGLMLTGLLAALASTIDTHLNWGASYWSNDLYGAIVNRRWLRREPGRRELVLVARASNLLIVGVALAITTRLGSIQQAWRLSLLFGAGIGSVLVLRWLWERVNLAAEIAAIVASLVAAPVLLAWVGTEHVRLALMAAVSTLAVVAAAWLGPPTRSGVLDEFYRRVRPPGWWSRTAARVGDDPGEPGARFRRGIRLVAATAATVYLGLVGATRLLLPTPGGSRLLGAVAALAALASVGWWWKDVASLAREHGVAPGPGAPRG